MDEGYDESELPERYKVLLRYIDTFLHRPGSLNDALKRDLRTHFTDEELVELTVYASLAGAYARRIISMGHEPPVIDEAMYAMAPTRDWGPARKLEGLERRQAPAVA